MDWVTTSTILSDLREFENRAAWDRFVQRFRLPIVSFARATGVHPSRCEDVAQETLAAFAQAFRDGSYDRTRGRLSHWLFGIAHRQALKQLRRDSRGAQPAAAHDVADEAGDAIPDERFLTTMWDMKWEEFVFQKCYEQARTEVEPVTAEAFELVVLRDLAPEDAAARLGVPVKTVYNAKHRLLRRIRELRAGLEDATPESA
jgi:RNA polymerase sigma-70 factor (ECF subfamily)